MNEGRLAPGRKTSGSRPLTAPASPKVSSLSSTTSAKQRWSLCSARLTSSFAGSRTTPAQVEAVKRLYGQTLGGIENEIASHVRAAAGL